MLSAFIVIAMNIVLYFFPVIGALIGYLIARLLITHFLKFQPTSRTTLSGIIQKNKFDIIDQVAGIAHEQVSIDQMIESWLNEERKLNLAQNINQIAGQYIEKNLPEKFPMIKLLGGDKITQKLKDIVEHELTQSMQHWETVVSKYASDQIQIKELLAAKLKEVELEQIHQFLVKLIRKQVINISSLFIITGFLIGMIFMFINIFILS